MKINAPNLYDRDKNRFESFLEKNISAQKRHVPHHCLFYKYTKVYKSRNYGNY